MKRACDCCGEDYEARTSRSRYCSDRCKRRYHRGARPDAPKAKKTARKKATRKQSSKKPPAGDPDEPAEGASPIASTEAATMFALQEAKQLGTPLGQTALILARRLDHGHMDTGSGLASLAKQLERTLAAATAGAEVEDDPVDELRAARERKRNAAAG